MADYSDQINQLTNILISEFTIRKQTGKIDNDVSAFWSKTKKIFSEELVSNLETNPDLEDTKNTLATELGEQFQNQRFIAHTAMFVNQYEKKK